MSDLPPFNPYDVLGVDKDADAATIKKAYRKLALIKHPDKCADETLKQIRTDEFQRLNEAYDILGDDEKRKRHDALVKLEALRKEKFAMGGPPRPFARAATFQNAYPGSAGTAYTTRGATNVEDRVPKGFYEEEDRYRRRSSNEYDYPRRSAGGTARADRTRAERDEERRRNERRRDESVREARSRKYDESDYHDERDWKREDPRDKYETWEESLKAYTTNRPGEARPTMGRRTSTTQVPRNVYATRSRAEPKEGRAAREDRDIFEKERDLQREQDRLARLKEEVRLRDEAKERRRRDEERDRRYEQERLEKAARRETERREQEQRDQERERERERSERESRRRTAKENVEPYERRPPQLQHNHTSPPNLPEGPPIRVRTDPVSSDSIPHPSMTRSSTMPSVPLSNSSARRTATGPSKLRETLQPDSGYSSNSSSEQRPGRTSAKNVKRHYYTVNHEPIAPSRRRSPSPERERERERPSMERASSKMANLAKHALRPGVSDYRSGSYSIPSRPRSPERSRRERDYERPTRPLYGERTGSFVEGVKYAKPITEEDISYSRRERDAYAYSASQRFDRRGHGVVPPTPQ